MKETFELNAQVRADLGKGASRRLRRTDALPAVIYGGNKEPQSITLVHHELVHHLAQEAFYSHVLTMKLDGKTEKVILRDLQRHPSKPIVLHADFLRVDEKTLLNMNVPLHFLNEDIAIGVKEQGGIVAHLATDVEVTCLPQDLPEYIEVDLKDLELGESIHLSQINVPEGVELVELSHGAEHDQAIVSINKPRTVVEEQPVTEAGAEAAPGSEEAGE